MFALPRTAPLSKHVLLHTIYGVILDPDNSVVPIQYLLFKEVSNDGSYVPFFTFRPFCSSWRLTVTNILERNKWQVSC